MRKFGFFIVLVLLGGCQSLGGSSQSPAAANVAMAALAALAYHQQYGCVPVGAIPPAAVACAPTTSTDPAVQQTAVLTCGLALAAQSVVKQCPTTAPVPVPPTPAPMPLPPKNSSWQVEPSDAPPPVLRQTFFRENDHGK
jgi:hypothetical protein